MTYVESTLIQAFMFCKICLLRLLPLLLLFFILDFVIYCKYNKSLFKTIKKYFN